MQSEEKVQKAYSQKCPSCGGDIVFNPKKQMLECVQCGTLIQVQSATTSEKSFEELLKNAPQWKSDTVVYRCEHCGAKAVVAKTDLAKRCEYCGATNIVRIEDLPGIRPDTIALFKITKDEALSGARKWLSKRFFAPKWYKKTVTAKNMSGIYYPAFTFDAQTISAYSGVQIQTHTRTTYVNDKPVVSTYTTRHPFSGRFNKIFDDILIPATNAISDEAMRNIQPFQTNEANTYKKEFLSGFTATHYDKDAMQCWQEAKTSMDQTIRREILRQYSGSVENLVINTTTTNITYKYVLLPVYVGHSEYEGKKYALFVNGQTGKVYGKTPVSLWKVLWITALSLAGIGALIALALFL